MDQERTINKLLTNILEFDLDMRSALTQAYAAGYDERGKDLNSHKTAKITKFTETGKKVRDYVSISQAAAMNSLARDTISDILKGKRKLTPDKKYYFKYSDQ